VPPTDGTSQSELPVVWAVVVAAGSGSRYGRPKQFDLLGGEPVVARSVSACRSVAAGVVLVLPEDRLGDDYGADVVVAGGRTRSDSVRCGLAAVPGDATVVVVHDAARPLAGAGLFAAVVAAVGHERAEGATCGLPVSDTLKRVDQGGQVTSTVERHGLVSVQTPQAFLAPTLRRAHRDDAEATDDAALVEALGATVVVVPGDPRNVKLTTPADLTVAEHLLGG
jgi:2-C-methyl-D-erythritol 4-phosphate cytidylyltransferase